MYLLYISAKENCEPRKSFHPLNSNVFLIKMFTSFWTDYQKTVEERIEEFVRFYIYICLLFMLFLLWKSYCTQASNSPNPADTRRYLDVATASF